MFPLVDLPDLFKMSKKRFEFFLENNPRQSTSFLFSVNINVVSLQLIYWTYNFLQRNCFAVA